MNPLKFLLRRRHIHRLSSEIVREAHTVEAHDGLGPAGRSGLAGAFARAGRWVSLRLARLLHRGRRAAEPDAHTDFAAAGTIDVTNWPQVAVMREKGSKAALSGIDPASTRYPTAVSEMIAAGVRMGDAAVASQVAALQALASRIAKLRLADLRKAIERAYSAASTQAEVVLTHAKEALPQFEEACDRASSQSEKFRDDNRLSRDPLPPTHWTMSVALLLAFLGGETLVNMPLFTSATEYGFEGAMLCAFIPALLNVVLSMSGGFIFGRQALRVQLWPRWLLGYLGSAVFMLLMVAAHYSYATYRHRVAVAGLEFGDAAHDLWASENLRAATGDATTLLLVTVGMLITAVSFYKGMRSFGDPYPGYEAVTRQLRRALALREQALKRIYGELELLKQSTDMALGTLLAQARERARQCKATAEEVVVLQQRHAAVQAQANAAVNHALNVFVEWYLRIRGPVPLPAVLRLPVRLELSVKPVAIDTRTILEANERALSEAQSHVDLMHKRLAEDVRLQQAKIKSWLKAHYGVASDAPVPDTRPVDDVTAQTFAYGPQVALSRAGREAGDDGLETVQAVH
jgi:hypothetical protein